MTRPNYNAGLHTGVRDRMATYPGSKEDRGGKTSKPAARSRSMATPKFKAKRDIKAGRFSSHPKGSGGPRKAKKAGTNYSAD